MAVSGGFSPLPHCKHREVLHDLPPTSPTPPRFISTKFQQELCSLPDSSPPWGKPPIPGQQLAATARAEVSHVGLQGRRCWEPKMNKSISALCALLQTWRDRGLHQALFHTNIFTANFFKMCNQIRQNHSAPAISSHEPLTVTVPVLSIGLEPKVEQQSPFPITHQLLGLVQHLLCNSSHWPYIFKFLLGKPLF